MGTKKLRLGSTLSFDSKKEKDIIKMVESLSNRHKLGEFLSNLIRVALDNQSSLGNREELSELMRDIEEYGMSTERKKFFDDISRDIADMKDKVNEMYDMNLKMYNLALMNKHMELESKSENSLRGQFILERQISKLEKALGVKGLNSVYESNKIQDTEEKAKDIMEFIINSYDGIITEIQNNTKVVTEVSEQETETTVLDNFEDTQEDEEYIDFGNADLDAIEAFMGE